MHTFLSYPARRVGRFGITLYATYPFPTATVWRALTERRLLAAWLMDNTFEPRVGHVFTFRTQARLGFDGRISGTVLEATPPITLSYTWHNAALLQPTIVTWTLQPSGTTTHLQFTHRGFASLRGFVAWVVLTFGWRDMLQRQLPPTLNQIAAIPG